MFAISPTTLVTFGVLGTGLVTACWTHVKSLLNRLLGLMVIRVSVEGSWIPPAIATYCWEHLKVSRGAFWNISGCPVWVRPLSKSQVVAKEVIGKKAVVFWKGWRPILVSYGEEHKGGPPNGHAPSIERMSITFIRGTFCAKQFILDCLQGYNSRLEQLGHVSRFYVQRYQGTFGMTGDHDPHDPPAATTDVPSADSRSSHPIGWTHDDLGEPLEAGAPMERLALSPEVDEAVEEARRWLKSKAWYQERKIMWRRGWLLTGPPGTGKSSLVRALGQDLGIPILVLDIATMTNRDMDLAWAKICNCAPCIVLIEDIDAVFEGRSNVLDKKGGGLSFDCLLNTIQGVGNPNGIFLVITTNHLDKVDPALAKIENGAVSRPGRIDRVMTMPTLTRDGRVKIARRILCDYPEMVEGIADAHPDTTGAQFEERCTTVALKEYWARKEVDRGPQPPNSDSFSRFLEVEQLKRGHSSGYVRDPEHVAAMRGALDGKRVDGY